MRMLLLAAATFALAACGQTPTTETAEAPAPEPAAIELAPESFTFTCANGVTFSVSYDATAQTATIEAGGQSYTLNSAVSASGARYEANGVEFWEHQTEATLSGAAGGPYESCRR